MRRCFYHTDLGQNAVFHNFEIQIHSFNIQDDRNTRGLFSETAKKISKITYTASRLRAVECGMNINRVALQHNKEFVMFLFYLVVL